MYDKTLLMTLYKKLNVKEIQTPFPRSVPGSQQRVKDRFARTQGVDEGCSGGLIGG